MPNPVVIEKIPSSPAQSDGSGKRRTRSFWVIAASEDDAEQVLYNDTGVALGARYQNHQGQTPDGALACVAVTPQIVTPIPVGGTGPLTVDAEYAYPSMIAFPPPSVALGRARWWVERGEESVPVDTDRHGNPIVNTADEAIDPPLSMLADRETLVAEWSWHWPDFLSAYDRFRPYHLKLNSAPIYGSAKRCLLCRMVVEEVPFPDGVGGQPLFRIQARFEHRPPVSRLVNGQTKVVPGWDDAYLNRGRRIKTDDPKRPYFQLPEKYTTQGGVPVPDLNERLHRDPVYLTDDGKSPLPLTDPPGYRVAEHYDDISFVGLVP